MSVGSRSVQVSLNSEQSLFTVSSKFLTEIDENAKQKTPNNEFFIPVLLNFLIRCFALLLR
ncbi:hypothetical protein SAMN05444483_10437 [Salegentibacter echinorum]|uniref:Uncharacterized protein n=1 Tax=Salegentibacter echinorum TaxID=1073325 RepID=A0A1M5G8K7_SALEC|nr:hypothetical protein SAMN05444483_10437 [Salegentibacter echinorum]